jgi:hypothetical protein
VGGLPWVAMITPRGAGPGEAGISELSGEVNHRPVANAARQGRWSNAGFLGLAAACVVPALYFLFVWRYSVNSFFEDDWSRIPFLDATMHGHLTLSLLWLQYNENRMLIPNLFWALFQTTSHADTKTIMLFDACLISASYAFLLVIHRRTVGRSLHPLQTVAVGLLWFSLADWENALWGFQIAWYLIIFFLMAMLLVLSRREITAVALVMAMLLAVAASFSSLQGLFAWPVGLLCILWRLDGRSRRLSYAASWVAAGTVTTALYLWHYTFQGGGGVGLGFDFRNPDRVVVYLLAAVGNAFPTGGGTAIALHALLGVLLCLVAIWVLVAMWRERSRTAGPHALPLPAALIVFALLFDVSISVGRVSLGINGALASRYTMANLLLLMGVILFALQRLEMWRQARTFSTSPLRVAGIAIVAVALVAQIALSARYGIENAQATRDQRILGARIAVNLSAIPVAARSQMATTYLFARYADFPIYFTLARQDELGAFASGPYQHYRTLGAPRKVVSLTLATFSHTLASWCKLTPGETRAHVYAQMGPPDGTEFALWSAAHGQRFNRPMPYVEWDVGSNVLVAIFEHHRVHALDAYSGTIPNPPTDIHCQSIRG